MGRRRWSVGLLAIACACKPEPGPLEAPTEAQPQQAFDDLVHLQERLDAIERQGREIYLRDSLAATAGDELVAAIDRLAEGWRPIGWLTWLEPQPWRVEIIGVHEDAVAVVFRVDFSSGERPVAEVVDPPAPLSAEAQRRWEARQLAVEDYSPRCTATVNPVVMPAGDEGWMVYLLPGTTDPSARIVGGHVQVWVGPDGAVREAAPLTRTCMIQQADAPAGGGLAAIMVSHVLTDHPRENHVFASLLYGIPIFVRTESHLWKVEEGHISVVED